MKKPNLAAPADAPIASLLQSVDAGGTSLSTLIRGRSRVWVHRTPEEEAQWRARAEEGARSLGLMIGLLGWAGAVILASFGWVVSFSTGLAVQRSYGGTFWTRLLVFAMLGSPIIFIARRVESRKALRKDLARTICPKCDTAAEGNAGSACQCGGAFVPASTVRWVE